MRISSNQQFASTVNSITDQQGKLTQYQQQISTGKGLLTPSDNPLGAAQAVELSFSSASVAQYQANQTVASSSLALEDQTLTSVSNTMQSVASLLVRAGGGSLTDADRASIAQELQSNRNQLLELSNTTDAHGNYLFSGFSANTPPFSSSPSGLGVVYNGDAGQRAIQISSTRNVPIGDSGDRVFRSVTLAASTPVSSSAHGNKGSGTISGVATRNTADPANNDAFAIQFSVAGGRTTYTVMDATTHKAVSSNQPYTAGATISLGGQSVMISGDPADHDSFEVHPAAQSGTDVFATLDTVIAALKVSGHGSAHEAALTNALTTAHTKVQNAADNVLAVRATVGGREQEVTSLAAVSGNVATQYQSDLSNLTSADIVGTISKFQQSQNLLQAAEQSFTSSQKLSLFNLL
jgi:flagellar hook-associated protein 3 FlgL